MKLNMKRAALGLCMAACLFSLSACSKADTETAIEPEVQMQMEQMVPGLLNTYVNIPEEEMDSVRNKTAKQEDGLALAEGIDAYKNVKHDLGGFKSIDPGVTVEEIEGGYSATITATFEKRELEFGITMDHGLKAVTSVSFAPHYTVAENMEQAFMNMIIGMGTVFIVLIVISLLIGCFKYINRFEEAMKKKNTPVAGAAPIAGTVAQTVISEENLADDLELVAVITAAIAASTGTSPSGLVVRSIKRAPAGNWKKA